MKTLPTNKIDLASRWRPQPAVGGPSQPRRVAKFLFKIQCPSQPLAAPASCIRMLHSSCSKSSAPHLAFASARLMALRRLVAVLPTSSQYPPNLFPTSSLFLSISFLYDTYTYTYAYVCYIVPVQNPVPPIWHLPRRASWHCVGWLLSSQLPPNILPTSSQRPPSS